MTTTTCPMTASDFDRIAATIERGGEGQRPLASYYRAVAHLVRTVHVATTAAEEAALGGSTIMEQVSMVDELVRTAMGRLHNAGVVAERWVLEA